ncbi:MAG: Mpo1-like protein [Bdellovibrionota bacterium]
MATQTFTSYSEFWPYYLSEHRHNVCRRLHYFGTTLVLGALAAGAAVSPKFFIAIPIVGYGPAWIGHFFFEHNRPATFSFPVWSFIGDFEMFFRMLTGKLSTELSRAIKKYPKP